MGLQTPAGTTRSTPKSYPASDVDCAFPESGPVRDEISWVEPSDAALAPVLAALWRLALATPRGETVGKPTLHAILRCVIVMAARVLS